MADLKALAETLVNLTVKEVSELAGILENDYGIKPAAAAVVAGPSGGGDSGAEAPAAQTEFDVHLISGGAGKLKVVKELKTILGLGLKEAKDLVDGAPALLKAKVSQEEANQLKALLEELGATAEIK
jgi:large subunit ribosomal protein L7/L12